MLKKILLIILAIGAIAAAVGIYLFNKTVPSLANQKADFTLTASQLFSDYDSDEAAANTMYLGKILEVSGTVSDMDKQGALVNVNLASNSDFGMVICKLDSNYANAKIELDQEITLKCQCNGFLMDVVLNRCAIVK